MNQTLLVPSASGGYSEDELAVFSFLARYKGATRDLYESDLRIFFEWCAAHGLKPLSATRVHLELFSCYLDEGRGNAPASIHRRLSTIKGFYRLACADDLIVKSPAEYLRMPRVVYDETRALGLSREDMSNLIYTARSLGPYDDALISMLALLGLRVSEACAVQIGDFGDDVRGHTVLRLTGKGGKPATLPLPPPVLRSMDRAAEGRVSGSLLLRRDGSELDRRTAYRWVKRVAKKAGVTDAIYPHALRHGAITAALDSGATLRDAQVFARHSDPRITSRYDRGRRNLDRHAAYGLSAYLSGSA